MKKTGVLEVTCAIIRNDDNEILLVQRGENSDHPFKWEFPGGKINEGESQEECVIREIDEELSMDIVICTRLDPVYHDYGNKQIMLFPFVCDTLDELPVLREHFAFKWTAPDELMKADFSGADKEVALQYLSSSLPCIDAEAATDIVAGNSFDEEELRDIINGMMSQQEADWMANSAIDNPQLFRKLIEYSYGSDRKLAFRSSWILTKVCDRNPELIFPHLDQLVVGLPGIDNESAERSFLRIISLTEIERIGKRQQGILADHCFSRLNSADSAIAIKAYSMEILYKLTLIYPELGNELAASIKMIMAEGSAGIVARGNMILRRIREIPLD